MPDWPETGISHLIAVNWYQRKLLTMTSKPDPRLKAVYGEDVRLNYFKFTCSFIVFLLHTGNENLKNHTLQN